MAMALPGRAQVTFGMDRPEMPEDFGIDDGWMVRGKERILAVGDLPLSGSHNLSNALAACALACQVGAPARALARGLRTFKGLPHRMQRVDLRGGVEWLDDSKGTNVGATVAALKGLSKKAVLILGGEGKGQNFSPLAPAVRDHAKAVLLLGRDAALIEKAIASSGVPAERIESMARAVKRAAQIAAPGDAVLLSPACASFDMFRDYKHRGDEFVAAVKAL
jgi:UDP-N-acetylmuramoylalanine--D-glutamate ligase